MTDRLVPWRTYHGVTRTATYGFLMALPLLVAYEVLIRLVNRDAAEPVRIGAEVWLKWVMPRLGEAGLLVAALAVVVIGAAVFLSERKKQIPLRPRYAGLLMLESTAYAFLLALLVSGLTQRIMAASQAVDSGMLAGLVLSIGAGLYEELLFRVLLVGALFLLLCRVTPEIGRIGAYVVAAVVGALLFSAVHYVGALGDAFSVGSFVYRALFGLALNVVFLVRGFGVAAWTHALYDVMVITGAL